MLFIELALIRWLGANVLYLAYFSNVVLLGSFLGIGLGFLWTSRGRPSLFPYAPAALATLIVLVRVLEVKVGIAGGSLIFFGLDTSGPPRWVILPVVFVAAAAVMTCIGDGVARAFGQLANLDAYQLDLVGSLLGIAAVALLAFRRAEPIVWGAIAAVGLVVAIRPRASAQLAVTVLPLLFALGFLFAESSEADTRWTPYYKVHTVPIEGQGGVVAEVNGIPTWLQISAVGNPIYETVYDRIARQDPGDVLIIGAGSGNDVAVANARGASRVDAVEIDGDLLDLGREHPDRPYDDPRVVTHVADGRAFLEQTDRDVGHDPARPPRLVDPAAGPVVGPARELLVHQGGRRVVSRPPRPRWHVRHVQLLPRAVARRRATPARSRRSSATRRASARRPRPCRCSSPAPTRRRCRAPTASCSPACPARPTRRPTTTRSRTCAYPGSRLLPGLDRRHAAAAR